MLEYMGDACVIRRVSLECNGEDIILVISGHVQIFRPSFLMLELKGCQL